MVQGKGGAMRQRKTPGAGERLKGEKKQAQGKKRVGKARKLWRKFRSMPLRIWPAVAALALLLVVLWLMPASDREGKPPLMPPAGGAPAGPGPAGGTPLAATGAAIAEKTPDPIRTVRLLPSHPTRQDRLRAEVVTAPGAEGLTFTYRWRVNDLDVPEASGEVLDLAAYRKGDLVSVTVTPQAGERAGVAVQSPLVLIHSAPPTLELLASRQSRTGGKPIELQLLATAPDGKVTGFSLEEPRLAGMTVEANSGRIVWSPQPDQRGTLRFAAAVVDDNGTKTVKTFEITLD